MAKINVSFSEPAVFKAFRYNETELQFNVSTQEGDNFWVECIVDMPPLLSLAQDKSMDKAKVLFGIVAKNEPREKRIKLFSFNNIPPDTYNIKLTFFIYDKEATIADRLELNKDIECRENGQVLQNP